MQYWEKERDEDLGCNTGKKEGMRIWGDIWKEEGIRIWGDTWEEE